MKTTSPPQGIRFAMGEPADLPQLQTCLRSNGLPEDDLAPILHDFCLARDAGQLVGTVGIERAGRFGLLRSLCVVPEYRGRGLAAALCDRAEAHARHAGIGQLYLLTTTAREFFERRGYALESRESAPDEIRQTAEYRSLCPASAALLSREVSGGPLYLPADLLPLRPDVPGARMWAAGLQSAMLTYFEVDADTRFDTHSHAGEQITAVIAGELFFEFPDRLVRAAAGDVVAIPAGVPHAVFTRATAARAFDAWSPPPHSYRAP